MNAIDIAAVFADCFSHSHRTNLVGGASEPLYQPAISEGDYHVIHFREDFEASALHEVAHWCIAGRRRRALTDFGYWYEGERDLAAQQAFEQMEVLPQSLEWMFSEAAGISFKVSLDNFDESAVDRDAFAGQVRDAVHTRLDNGLAPRPEKFLMALIDVTGNGHALDRSTYERLPT